MTEKATPPKNHPAWDRAALAGTSILVLGAVVVSVCALRGPLSMEALAGSMARLPRAVWALLAIGCGAPGVVAATRPGWERVVAALGAVGGALLAYKLPSAWPRAAFDDWERSFALTHAGVPWAAVFAMVLGALLVLSFALSVRRVIEGPATNGEKADKGERARWLPAALALASLVAFALPASAAVHLATGSRLLPVGEPDELWAPAFTNASCPPAPEPPKPPPSVASSAPKP